MEKPEKEKENNNGPIAHELAKRQREISVAEFFERNRHLLGFDNKRKALLTVVKEAVDNALDACEEAKILPEVSVNITDMGNDRFKVVVEDNGPGIVKKQIPSIFAQLLYGSKFHTMKQARGQQGIGISAAVLYSQLTTGRPARITSRISPSDPTHYYELHIDTKQNKPLILKDERVEWKKEHGTRVELDIEASYLKGDQSVDAYLKQTAIVNPHATIIYTTPKAEQLIFPRATNELPREPVAIKPHPYGVELGMLSKMLKHTECRTLQSFLVNEFSRVGAQTAHQICDNANLLTNARPKDLGLAQIELLLEGIKKTKIISPPPDCITPIGSELLEKGLRKEIAAEFYTATSRTPCVYRGIPFVVEAALAYGGSQESEAPVRLLRFANRVPLLYQQGACAIFKSVIQTNWRQYRLSQSQAALPIGPLTIAVSLVSVWPPFTSEAKEAIAHYPEIIKEVKLALQECGRQLSMYINRKRRAREQQERVNVFENYIPELAESLSKLSNVSKSRIADDLKQILNRNKTQILQVQEMKFEKKTKEDQIKLSDSLDNE